MRPERLGKRFLNEEDMNNKILPNRKNLRLSNYDYKTPGYYFVTICTHNKKKLFGTVDKLSDMGCIARDEIERLANKIDCVAVDKYIVMPDHIHAILVVGRCDNACKASHEVYLNPAECKELGEIIQLYKAGVSRRIHREIGNDIRVWQRSYYDVILDTDRKYDNAWYYIENNPIEEKIRKSEYGFLGDD